jgi:hypothetical protein
MSLSLVAEILSGETLVSPSGPIDKATTTADVDVDLWNSSDIVDLVAGPTENADVVVLAVPK